MGVKRDHLIKKKKRRTPIPQTTIAPLDAVRFLSLY